MKIKKRSAQDLAVDEATSNNTIRDADLSTAEVVYPRKNKKIMFKIDLDEKIFEVFKKIADKKQIDDYSQLLDQYIRDGIEKDEKLLI